MLLHPDGEDDMDGCACRMLLLSLQEELGDSSCIALIPCHDVSLGESEVDKDVVCRLVLPLLLKGSPSVVVKSDAEKEDGNDDDCRVLVP